MEIGKYAEKDTLWVLEFLTFLFFINKIDNERIKLLTSTMGSLEGFSVQKNEELGVWTQSYYCLLDRCPGYTSGNRLFYETEKSSHLTKYHDNLDRSLVKEIFVRVIWKIWKSTKHETLYRTSELPNEERKEKYC